MNPSLKSALKEILPPITLRGYRFVKRLIIPPPQQPAPPPNAAQRNIQLKDRHRNLERCFIVGNGPSLKQQNLLPLRNEVVFVCNYFNLHPQCAEISPSYWCSADPDTFYPHHTSLVRPESEADRRQWFEDLRMKMPRAEIFVPVAAKEEIEKQGWFRNRVVWYVDLGDSSHWLNRVDTDLTHRIPWGQGTINALAIPAAIYMGFKKIYLIGNDCNMFVENLIKEDLEAEVKHFYTSNPFAARDVSIQDLGLEFWFRSLGEFYKSYRLLREHAEARGVQIINATKGGLLDVFPRCNYEELVRSSDK